MKITIIRHGKVNMQWKKWYTSQQFDMDCENYDVSSIHPIEEKIERDVPVDIYISTLKRSRETAIQLFGEKEFTETELLNEVPLKSCFDCKIRLPLWIWNVGGRMQWLFQKKRQLEKRGETEQRADALIEKLLEKDRDCILISHGFFMRTLQKELNKYGFQIAKKKFGFANLERVTAEK